MFHTKTRNRFAHSTSRSAVVRRLRLEPLESRLTPSHTILVDDDGRQFHNRNFSTIQAAVNLANPGDLILVATGNYVEQVVIPAGKNNLDIRAYGFATITAPATFGDASNAIVHDAGATGLRLWGFQIQGNGSATGPDFGVLVDLGGSADVSYNHIVNIRDNPLGGRQEGVAIQFGQLTMGGSGTGKASANRIEGYQKGGIVVIGAGSSADVTFNTVRGAGATSAIAQNGIQVSDGATARVDWNTVSGNKFTGEDFEGVGILIFNTSNVRVRGNTTFGNDEGILLFGDTAGSPVLFVTVEFNTSNNNTFNGIGLSNVFGSIVQYNTTNRNLSDGINIEAAMMNQVIGNSAYSNGRAGIAMEGDTIMNTLRFNSMFGNFAVDAFDATRGGTGTGGTSNTWQRNFFRHAGPATLN
jgi:parallel beta-helix repeat protein